jgi:hypothetical protein
MQVGSGAALLSPPVRRWACVACPATDTTAEVEPHTRMHACPAAGGMSVPMVPAGTRGRLQINMREDYVGREDVQRDADGRVVMSVNVIRDDGMDCAVYAPTATSRGEAVGRG